MGPAPAQSSSGWPYRRTLAFGRVAFAYTRISVSDQVPHFDATTRIVYRRLGSPTSGTSLDVDPALFDITSSIGAVS
jgi:hypothetical protein